MLTSCDVASYKKNKSGNNRHNNIDTAECTTSKATLVEQKKRQSNRMYFVSCTNPRIPATLRLTGTSGNLLVQDPCSKQSIKEFCSGPCPLGFVYFHGWRLHRLSDQECDHVPLGLGNPALDAFCSAEITS